jgi:hypothetical protein
MVYWKDHPPTHVLVGAYLMGGNKSPSSKRRHDMNHGDTTGDVKTEFHELARQVALAGGTAHRQLPDIYRHQSN